MNGMRNVIIIGSGPYRRTRPGAVLGHRSSGHSALLGTAAVRDADGSGLVR